MCTASYIVLRFKHQGKENQKRVTFDFICTIQGLSRIFLIGVLKILLQPTSPKTAVHHRTRARNHDDIYASDDELSYSGADKIYTIGCVGNSTQNLLSQSETGKEYVRNPSPSRHFSTQLLNRHLRKFRSPKSTVLKDDPAEEKLIFIQYRGKITE